MSVSGCFVKTRLSVRPPFFTAAMPFFYLNRPPRKSFIPIARYNYIHSSFLAIPFRSLPPYPCHIICRDMSCHVIRRMQLSQHFISQTVAVAAVPPRPIRHWHWTCHECEFFIQGLSCAQCHCQFSEQRSTIKRETLSTEVNEAYSI